MKVRAYLNIDKENNNLSVTLDKDGVVGCLVGFYEISEYERIKQFTDDMNAAFTKMWH